MKIELGKFYRTRCGHKARVICVDRRGSLFPIVALVDDDGFEDMNYYYDDGRICHVEEKSVDIIEGWAEPAAESKYTPEQQSFIDATKISLDSKVKTIQDEWVDVNKKYLDELAQRAKNAKPKTKLYAYKNEFQGPVKWFDYDGPGDGPGPHYIRAPEYDMEFE